jgi:hypothetical protein
MGSLWGNDAPAPTPIVQQAPAALPTPLPPPTMPDSFSPDSMAAKRRAQQDVMGRAGRSSTILSSAMERTGSAPGKTGAASTAAAGGGYDATKLGAGA